MIIGGAQLQPSYEHLVFGVLEVVKVAVLIWIALKLETIDEEKN